MDRYNVISANDDPSLNAGDGSFVGVNEWDAQENLEPGQVQAAVNIDFTSQDAVTRGGFVCLPSLGITPFSGSGTWTIRDTPTNTLWTSVAFGNNAFVAVANSGSTSDVMRSTDGITWTTYTGAAANNWTSICYGNGTFVAVAQSGSGNRVMTSADGVTWTARTSAADNQWQGVCFGNGLFVAVADSGTGNRVMTSPNGTTWTIRTSAADNSWRSVVYGGSQFVAVGSSGTTNECMTSPNGITWTLQSTGASSGFYTSVAYGNAVYVAVALTGNKVIVSSDAITWTEYNNAEANSWKAICFGNGQFVAVGDSGTNRIMTSTNGQSWTAVAAPGVHQWRGVVNGKNTFVAVGYDSSTQQVMTAGATNQVYASGVYSDPNDAGSQWIMLVGQSAVGFYAFGKQNRTIYYENTERVSEQSTVVQCNNQVYIFRGADETPLYWNGNWSGTITLAPAATPLPGFDSIANSNQATFYQNRLWVIDGKDAVAASDVLTFDQYDQIANAFNLNTGSSDFLVTTYPFGTTTLLVFKNRSILALTGVDGSLSDVSVTEITRQVGCIGINAVVSVGSDVVYMSDRNINLISLTDTNNSLQHQTLPLSRNIQRTFQRVNWNYAYKVSMAYFDNKIFVALPLDNATSCNAVCVYNFVTQNWFGEWTFDSLISMQIQGWVVANYLGSARLHCATEDGRIFVVGEGQNDISGTTCANISTSVTTRAYVMDNNNRINRRVYLDLATNRPNFTITAYSEGASESTVELSGQTFSRASSWIFNDSAYDLTNANDDFNRAYRKDYSTGPNSVQPGSGFLPEMEQEFRLPIISRRQGRLAWIKLTNTTGVCRLMNAGFEARPGQRNSLIQV